MVPATAARDDGEHPEYGVVETHAFYAGTKDSSPHQSYAPPQYGVAAHIWQQDLLWCTPSMREFKSSNLCG